MNPSSYVITLMNGNKKTIQCHSMGIMNDGSLLCVSIDAMGQTTPVQGYAAGEWSEFSKSSLQSVN
jgi:hypothetical protein